MPFVVFAAPFSSPEFYFCLPPPPALYNFPAVHCVISPLLSRNAPWNTTGYGVWPWWWGKHILHHHMKLLLLGHSFSCLCCRIWKKNKCASDSLCLCSCLCLSDAAYCVFYIFFIIVLGMFIKWSYALHVIQLQSFLFSQYFFFVCIPSPNEPDFVPYLAFFSPLFLHIHLQLGLIILTNSSLIQC